jgi:methionyl-tRNA formyltransferase
MTNPNFIFIGGTYRGFKLLEAVINLDYFPQYIIILKEDNHEIEKYSEELSNLAIKYSIDFSVKKKLDSYDIEVIKSRIWDFAIVCGWRTIIPYNLDCCFKHGFIAAHDSLLPKYRGFSPLNWVIINGESETGVTLFKISEGEVDSGDIIYQVKIPIEKDDYAIDLFKKITQATIDVYLNFMQSLQKGEVIFHHQNEAEATYTCKRSPNDGKIDWSKSSNEIYNFIRALAHPYPGAFCKFGDTTFHIRKAGFGKNNNKKYSGKITGKVLTINKEYIEVMCNEGTINLYLWEDKSQKIIEIPSKSVVSITTVLK